MAHIFQLKKLMTNIIEAKILTGPLKDEDALKARIPMIPTDMSFQFKMSGKCDYFYWFRKTFATTE